MNIHYLKSWEHFKEIAEETSKDGPNGPNIFRGQADEDWDLSPSLTRIFNNHSIDHVSAIEIERKILFRFQELSKNQDEFCRNLRSLDFLSWWEIMQHHSLPTRLLDWSKSPYAAIFYAVNSYPETNGAFIIMTASNLHDIQSIRSREDENKPQINNFIQIDKSVRLEEYEKVMTIITCPTPTERMKSQSSSFSLSSEITEPHDITADNIVFSRIGNPPEEKYSIFDKYIIPKNLKKDFLSKLNEIDINASTLFPDTRVIDELKKELDLIIKDLLDRYN